MKCLPPHTLSNTSTCSGDDPFVYIYFVIPMYNLRKTFADPSALTSKHAMCGQNEGVEQPDNRSGCKQ